VRRKKNQEDQKLSDVQQLAKEAKRDADALVSDEGVSCVALAVHLDVDVYQQPAARRSNMGKNQSPRPLSPQHRFNRSPPDGRGLRRDSAYMQKSTRPWRHRAWLCRLEGRQMRDASGGLRRGSHVVEGKGRHGLGDAQL
jgi:hypothetical protein